MFVQTRQEDFSAPVTYNTCVYRGTEIVSRGLQQGLEQDRTARTWTDWEQSFLKQSTFMSPSGKQENGTSSVALFGSPSRGKSSTENLTFQRMQHGFTSSATSTQRSSLQVEGLASQQSVNELQDSMTTPVQHHCQANLGDKVTMWRSSSKQSMPSSVAKGKEKPLILILSQTNFKEDTKNSVAF